MNQMRVCVYVGRGRDQILYIPNVKKTRLHMLTKSRTTSTNIYFFVLCNKSNHIPLTALFWKDKSARKKIINPM